MQVISLSKQFLRSSSRVRGFATQGNRVDGREGVRENDPNASERKKKQKPASSTQDIGFEFSIQTHISEDGKDILKAGEKESGKRLKNEQKSQAELDEELRLKLEGISGEGGTTGVEYEGGKAVGLKRGVRDNMFRVI